MTVVNCYCPPNNYSGISLLCIVGKLFARVVPKRLQALAERVYSESQCGFRSQRSTVEMVLSLRQLQEKCREQRKRLYFACINLTKAFDLVSRDGLFKILAKIGCPPTLLSTIQSFHEDMKGAIVYAGSTSEAFDIRNGVKQGCVLAPTVFGIFFAVMLKHAFGITSTVSEESLARDTHTHTHTHTHTRTHSHTHTHARTHARTQKDSDRLRQNNANFWYRFP